jgi:hypothetical protein
LSSKHKYSEQFERMMRWYRRFEDIRWSRYKPFSDGVSAEEVFWQHTDDVLAFFLNCYHLKDWIKQDDTISESARDEVETYINENKCLRICADLCNSIKHLKLTSRRELADVALDSSLWTSVGTDSNYILVKVSVVVDDTEQDAFELASECIQKWQEFVTNHL